MFPQKFFFASKVRLLRESAPAPALLGVLALAGCANPGPPHPPSLHLPAAVTQLAAERVGTHVLLSWATPTETTDGETLRPPVTAAICRQDLLQSALPSGNRRDGASPHLLATPAPPCNPVQRVAVTSGPSRATEILPPDLLSGPPVLVAYRVELLNARNRSAGYSAPVYVAGGAAPPDAGPLEVEGRRNGPLIRWQTRAPEPMEVERTPVPSGATPAEKPAAIAQAAPATRLSPPQGKVDPGGIVDRTVHDGDTVLYVGQRVEVATFKKPLPRAEEQPTSGRGTPQAPLREEPATLSLELRGAPSPAVRFTFHDTFPPSAPRGLAAVAESGFGEAASIDLSWESNSEDDVRGYNVYRAEDAQDSSPPHSPQKINAAPVAGTAFRDLNAKPGVGYQYRVTAVDERGNESAPSAAFAATIRP